MVRPLPLVCDVRNGTQVEAAIEACVSEFARLDVVVNKGGPLLAG
ncbi:hypothetical protein [Blastococcus sp. URHD0036]|nr:hypothetical protein [Blastococcus sp. URHD0036]